MTLAVVAGSVLLAGDTVAQDATVASQPAAVVQSAPRLYYSTAEILKMVQAKVGESTILAYIQNSNMTFPLDAAQIIYMKQQGASNAILDAMLNHQPVATATAAQTSVAATQDSTAVAQTSTAVAQPTVTYVQTAAPSPVYVSSYPYYYPYYGYYPYYSPVTVSLGFGGYWGGGYYYRGGYYGGWHGGYYGGWHGGGSGWHR